jgi:hypothetical protein
MRMFLLGVIVMLLIGVGAAAALDAIQKPASVAFSTGGARPDPE